ncbi:MAG: 16S rRNA (cytosine(1402)-N(4))-methyltransferase RsmH [Erysipelotrichaceae bacterium]|nr:16S rRNA (cytosine(1402)-N(4))-methyltransferase RsmH [Erysipelotrichaceae bacterium]
MSSHYSVMKEECLSYLDVKEDGVYVDGTLGRGGHTREILERAKKGRVYAFDLDETAIRECREALKDYPNLTLFHANYAEMKDLLPEKADGILLDLGVSSPQFDDISRGFSYRGEAALDMRMDVSQTLNARTIVNEWSEEELIRIFREYGEEKFAGPIARKIVKVRQDRPIETTTELVDLIRDVLPQRVLREKGHPAKQVFQALRIAVNDELGSLETVLQDLPELLNVGGRAVILSFHSLEDRLVKRRFHELSTVEVDKRIPLRPEEIEEASFELLNRKALKASEKELGENSRSHSVRLRAIRKVR